MKNEVTERISGLATANVLRLRISSLIRSLRYLKTFFFIFFLLMMINCAQGADCLTAAANRTFMQMWRDDANRTAADWDRWFENLDNLGFSEIIVQWSSFGPVNFYMDPVSGHESSDTLSAFIKAAGRFNKKVWIGLHYDPDFWKKITENPDGPGMYLRDRSGELEQRLPFLLRTLNAADPQEEVIRGWYVSDEIDDRNWQDPARRRDILRYLKCVRRKLRMAMASWPVLISGFANGEMAPAQWTSFWNELLSHTRIDGLLFQDGIGAAKLTFEELEGYLQSLSDVLGNERRFFGVIIEIFQIAGTSESPDGIQAAEMGRIAKQLKLAHDYSHYPITVFSGPDYMKIDGDAHSIALYRAWRKANISCE